MLTQSAPAPTQLAAGRSPRSSSPSLEEFNQLVLLYQNDVFNLAYYLMGCADDAEDMAQAAFLKAYENFSSYRGDSFRSWVLTILRNLCYDEFRRRKRRPSQSLETAEREDEDDLPPETTLADPAPLPEEWVEIREDSRRVQQALARLPRHYAEAAVLVDMHGLDYAQAAEIAEVPVGTVKSRLARARRMLSVVL